MGDIIDSKSNRMSISTYSSIQTVRYKLKSENKMAIEHFSRKDILHDEVPRNLTENLRKAFSRYKTINDDKKTEKENKKRRLDVNEQEAPESKKAPKKMNSWRQQRP